MEHNQKMLEVMEEMEKNSRKQVMYGRLQFIFAAVAAVCCAVLLFAGLKVLPELQAAATQAEIVLNNLEEVTTDLAKVDLGSMVENVDGLVSDVDALVGTSQNGIEETMEKLNKIDFDALNQAIEDLSDVIEPIAKFFKTFR